MLLPGGPVVFARWGGLYLSVEVVEGLLVFIV